MSLITLPPELIITIADLFDFQRDLLSLIKTSCTLHALLHPRLVPFNVKHRRSCGLTLAAKANNIALAREFLKAGADPNVPVVTMREFYEIDLEEDDRMFITDHGYLEKPLYVAVENGHEQMALLLVYHGADPATTDVMGVTVSDVAKSKGNYALCCLLQMMKKGNMEVQSDWA